jgi:hypothetical protein
MLVTPRWAAIPIADATCEWWWELCWGLPPLPLVRVLVLLREGPASASAEMSLSARPFCLEKAGCLPFLFTFCLESHIVAGEALQVGLHPGNIPCGIGGGDFDPTSGHKILDHCRHTGTSPGGGYVSP